MKIQLASDLHLELLGTIWGTGAFIEPAPEADVLVLAGDIHNGIQFFEVFKDWPVPVLYLAGNHEFYGQAWEQTRANLRRICAGTNIHFLDNDRIEIAGVRFLGCTLWTDFHQEGLTQSESMAHVERGLNDYHRISTQAGVLTTQQTLEDHRLSRQWLERELAKPHPGRTVVVTHHAPHPLSIHPRFLGNPLNAGFVSDLTPLLDKVDLWLHGHVHDSFDYRVGKCRVVANPAGYTLNRRDLKSMGDRQLENLAFDGMCVLELTDA